MMNDTKQNQNIAKPNQTIPYHTIPNNTKIGITRTFLKIQAPDFAWLHIRSKDTHQIMWNHTIPNQTKT